MAGEKKKKTAGDEGRAAEAAVDHRADQVHEDTVESLAKDAMNALAGRITDEVFQIIQKDASLMKRYLHLVERDKLEGVNPVIARLIKEHFNLKATDEHVSSPVATIIQSHARLALNDA